MLPVFQNRPLSIINPIPRDLTYVQTTVLVWFGLVAQASIAAAVCSLISLLISGLRCGSPGQPSHDDRVRIDRAGEGGIGGVHCDGGQLSHGDPRPAQQNTRRGN